MKKIIILSVAFLSSGFMFSACEKKDPFVDRIVSPVLVVFKSPLSKQTDGLTTDPTINVKFDASAAFDIGVFELYKTNILDYTKGIDSLPVAGTQVKLKIRNGAEIGSFTTDGTGLAKVSIGWDKLGITTAGKSASLSVTGSYKDVSFSKLFKVASK